jgi:predicted esterase
MRRLLVAGVALALLPATGAVAATATATATATSQVLPTTARLTGLPGDGPPALYRPETTLPAAHGWPGPESFPRTSGTGRLADGGFFWTDYLYDDHGATTASTGGPSVTAGTPSFGTYTYPSGPASGNGADIFRAAVLLKGDATYWRVDWTTLADPTVPVAEWTFDRDDNAKTGTSTWPAKAGITSAGIDTALVVSSRGAQLIDVASGTATRLPVTVDRAAQSFVVRIPASTLKPNGAWRIRLAAGLADKTGTTFAQPPDATPLQPAVYNVTFRTRAQETPKYNFWDDMAQTQALDQGDVSAFSALVRWSDLAARTTTPEARPTGWSDRWYVSSVDLGPGVRTDPSTIEDGQPNYLGRVQPYGIYVPTTYDAKHPAPLTFLLHSLTQNHNQYAATTPNFVQEACEQRHSICVTTLGRGPDGFYHDYAELDFWQVWHAVASAYALDPERTVLSGYSMGGIGSNQLAMQHPDLYAKSVTLAGGVGNLPALVNLRWVPTYLAGGAEDELVWATTEKAEADALDALGYRYRWMLYPVLDHVVYELADSFADAARYMGDASRVKDPGHVTFRWTPRSEQTSSSNQLSQGGIAWTQRPDLGIGTTGAYWLRDLQARSTASDAQVDAISGARPDAVVTPVRSRTVDPTNAPEPAIVTQLTWRTSARPPATPRLTLHLTNVAALTVLLADAGFKPGTKSVLDVMTDGPTRLRLGTRTVQLAAGHHTLWFTA